MKKLVVILIFVVITATACESEESRIKRQVEISFKQNEQNVRSFNSQQHLQEAKRLMNAHEIYFSRKHLEAIPQNASEYTEAQQLLEEIRTRETEQAKIRAQQSPINLSTNVKDSVEFKLASLNAGSIVSEDDITVKRFRYLLEQLEAKTTANRDQIADLTFNSQKLLREKYGKDVSLLDLMEKANRTIPANANHSFNYQEVISTVSVLSAN